MTDAPPLSPPDTPPQPSARHFAKLAALVHGVIVFLFFIDVLFKSTTLLSEPGLDLTSYLLPLREYGFGQIAQGRLPLWNPHMFAGTPLAANVQAALFYPPNALYLLLPAVVATNWTIALHFWLAAWLTSLWAHSRTHARIPALLAGLAYAFCGGYFLHLHPGHLTILCAAAWPPLLLWCVDRYLEPAPWRPRVRHIALGAIAIAMPVVAGHPQIAYYAGLTAGLYLLAHLSLSPRKTAAITSLATAALLGAALTSVQLLPSREFSNISLRQVGLSHTATASYALPPENVLFGMFLPHLFGTAGRNDYLGRWFIWEGSLYVGVVVLLLAIYSITTGTRLRRIAGVVIVLILMAGVSAPIQDVLWRWFPAYSLFRAAGRFGIFIDLLLAVMAADGLASLLHRPAGPPRRLIALAATGVALTGVCALLVHSPNTWLRIVTALRDTGQSFLPAADMTNPAILAYSRSNAVQQFAAAAATFLIVSLVFATWRRRPGTRRACAILLTAIAAAELLWPARIDRTSGIARLPYPAVWAASAPTDPDARLLTLDPAYANFGLFRGDLDATGYDPSVLARYAKFLAITQALPTTELDAAPNINRNSPLFRIPRVQRVFFGADTGAAKVVARTDALPRFHWVHHYEVHSPSDVEAALRSESFDPAKTVLLESDPSPKPVPDAADGTVRVLHDSPESIEIEATTPASAILLMTDAYAPGWHVVPVGDTRTQEHYDVLPADLAFRAIPLTAGTHRIRIEYTAPGLVAGAWISGFAAIAIVALLVCSARAKPRP